jgi:putative addiction module component (TIGR02574 family)
MPASNPSFDIDSLSLIEKIDLIGQLWDSLPDTGAALPMPEWHQRELEQRLAAADADPEAAVSWDNVKNRLRQQP